MRKINKKKKASAKTMFIKSAISQTNVQIKCCLHRILY